MIPPPCAGHGRPCAATVSVADAMKVSDVVAGADALRLRWVCAYGHSTMTTVALGPTPGWREDDPPRRGGPGRAAIPTPDGGPCPQCGGRILVRRSRVQRFCSSACGTVWRNARRVRYGEPWTPERIEAFRAAWTSGLSPAGIAAAVGIGAPSVFAQATRLRRAGVPIERRPGPGRRRETA